MPQAYLKHCLSAFSRLGWRHSSTAGPLKLQSMQTMSFLSCGGDGAHPGLQGWNLPVGLRGPPWPNPGGLKPLCFRKAWGSTCSLTSSVSILFLANLSPLDLDVIPTYLIGDASTVRWRFVGCVDSSCSPGERQRGEECQNHTLSQSTTAPICTELFGSDGNTHCMEHVYSWDRLANVPEL